MGGVRDDAREGCCYVVTFNWGGGNWGRGNRDG